MINQDIKNGLEELGFTHLGSFWYSNELNTIRIRLWKDNEIDFWLWEGDSNEDADNQIHFRGVVKTIDEVKWILERCFNMK